MRKNFDRPTPFNSFVNSPYSLHIFIYLPVLEIIIYPKEATGSNEGQIVIQIVEMLRMVPGVSRFDNVI